MCVYVRVTWDMLQHAQLECVGGYDLSQSVLQISIIKPLQIQECSAAALFITLLLSPHALSLTSFLPSLHPSHFAAFLQHFPPSIHLRTVLLAECLCNAYLPANTWIWIRFPSRVHTHIVPCLSFSTSFRRPLSVYIDIVSVENQS